MARMNPSQAADPVEEATPSFLDESLIFEDALDASEALQAPMTWVAVVAQLGDMNKTRFKHQTRDELYFEFPEDETKYYPVSGSPGLGVRMNINAKMPYRDKDKGLWIWDVNIYLSPLERNTKGGVYQGKDVAEEMLGARSERLTQHIVDEDNHRRPIEIQRITVPERITPSLHDSILMRLVKRFCQEIRRIVEVAGMQFEVVEIWPYPTGEVEDMRQGNGGFKIYVK